MGTQNKEKTRSKARKQEQKVKLVKEFDKLLSNSKLITMLDIKPFGQKLKIGNSYSWKSNGLYVVESGYYRFELASKECAFLIVELCNLSRFTEAKVVCKLDGSLSKYTNDLVFYENKYNSISDQSDKIILLERIDDAILHIAEIKSKIELKRSQQYILINS